MEFDISTHIPLTLLFAAAVWAIKRDRDLTAWRATVDAELAARKDATKDHEDDCKESNRRVEAALDGLRKDMNTGQQRLATEMKDGQQRLEGEMKSLSEVVHREIGRREGQD